MAAEDARVRNELAADGSLFHGYHPRMREVHGRNGERLVQIMAGHGWPVAAQVGADAADAAWLVVQHAIGKPDLQRRALAALLEAAARGEAPAWQAAMLDDRIRTLEGRPQRYGTQLDWNADGQLAPLPIEEPLAIAERRRSVGLPPLEDAVAQRRRAADAEGDRPPSDWPARQEAMQRWLVEVGWRMRP